MQLQNGKQLQKVRILQYEIINVRNCEFIGLLKTLKLYSKEFDAEKKKTDLVYKISMKQILSMHMILLKAF